MNAAEQRIEKKEIGRFIGNDFSPRSMLVPLSGKRVHTDPQAVHGHDVGGKLHGHPGPKPEKPVQRPAE